MVAIGIRMGCHKDTNFEEYFTEAKAMGITSCQLSMWDMDLYTDEYAERILDAMKKVGFRASLVWAGWTGPNEWNFYGGPSTLGLVPVALREMRFEQLRKASDFALKLGVTDIATHVGFLPEDPNHPDYTSLVPALRHYCNLLKSRGQNFLFETGQETPVTLLRCIEDIGTGNVFINFDTANVILYGKGSAVGSVTMFGQYVRNTHIKDGFYPTNGRYLGTEVKVGTGLIDLPEVVRILKEKGYTGPWTIEREIEGEQQKKDIAETVKYIHEVLGE